MMSVDLFAEFGRAVARLDELPVSRLAKLGLSDSCLYGGASLVGMQRVSFLSNGLYEPDDNGVTAMIVPCGERGEAGILWHHIDDLVAFRPGTPSRWAARYRSAPILNSAAADRAAFLGELLAVWVNPLSWLRHGGHGVVVLDWRCHLPLHLGALAQVACENEFLARRLDAAMRQPAGPEIRVIKVGHGHAA